MSVNVEIRPLPTHLHVTLTGECTYEGLKDAILRIRQAGDENESAKILIDCRRLTGNPSLRERFELVAIVLQLRINAILYGKPSKSATAIVASPPLLHPNRYGVRLLVERHLKITVCANVEEALGWLGIEAEPSA